MIRTRPTLVLYARLPRAGAVKTRMQPFLRAREALELHQAMLEDSLRLLRWAAERAGARPVLAFSEAWEPEADGAPASLWRAAGGIDRLPQRGGPLGERLRNTLSDLRAAGEGEVVIFGSDSPTLPPVWLEAACEALSGRAGVVLGPALDGGYYLVGTGPGAAVPFEAIPWGTDRALLQTLRVLRSTGTRPALLPPWYDVDRPDDLGRVRRDLSAVPGFAPERTAAFIERLASTGRLR
ncbi:MAG: TIGR04282 family arsenosugar biosynthesis glycosyltransferase [Acidobacteriota bacterium]